MTPLWIERQNPTSKAVSCDRTPKSPTTEFRPDGNSCEFHYGIGCLRFNARKLAPSADTETIASVSWE
jgi:hypothetical protein